MPWLRHVFPVFIYMVVFMYVWGGCVGFPLDKAVEYAKLRNPLLINDLNMQYYIQDRYVDRYDGKHSVIPALFILCKSLLTRSII